MEQRMDLPSKVWSILVVVMLHDTSTSWIKQKSAEATSQKMEQP